jgi:hypothetical protein
MDFGTYYKDIIIVIIIQYKNYKHKQLFLMKCMLNYMVINLEVHSLLLFFMN